MQDINFKSLFESSPGLYLALSPELKIIAASDAYLDGTMTKREEIIGKELFHVFPDNPEDLLEDGISNLRASLNSVLKDKSTHAIPIQKYDLRRTDGVYETRYWSHINKPVVNDKNEVICIIHKVEDVTDYIRLQMGQMTDWQGGKNDKPTLQTEVEIFIHTQKIQGMYAALDNKIRERTRELEINEEKYRNTLNNLQEGVQIIGFDWRYIYINEALTKQTRNTADDLIGHTLMEKYPGIEETEMFKALKKCMEQRLSRHFENEHTYPDHSKGYFDLMIQPVPEGVLILSIDISERKKAEDEIRKLNANLENKIFERTSALENAYQEISDYKFALDISSIVSITDQNGVIQYANNNFCKISGYNAEELIGKDHRVLNSGAHPKGFMADIWATVKSGNIWKGEIKNKAKDSGFYWLHVTIIPFLDERGQPYKYMALQKDITNRKIIEEKIVKDSTELENLNKELDSFTYSVSHDLRAPLRAIGGYTRMLEEDFGPTLNEEGKRLLGVIRENAIKMGNLIDDLLNFSRLGKKEIQKTQVDMLKLTQQAVEGLKISMDHKSTVNVNNLRPAFADNSLMGLVMANLLSNAIKYSSKKEKPVIEIKSKALKGETVYSVSDNGVGFDMQYAHKLFGVFQRLHSENEFAGTGVGLAIVQRIINKHGGRVWVEAEPEKGATFYFTLPGGN